MKGKCSYNGSGKGFDTEGSVNEVARNVIILVFIIVHHLILIIERITF